MPNLLFIVSATEPGRYAYLKHVFAREGGMEQLQSSGWALVKR